MDATSIIPIAILVWIVWMSWNGLRSQRDPGALGRSPRPEAEHGEVQWAQWAGHGADRGNGLIRVQQQQRQLLSARQPQRTIAVDYLERPEDPKLQPVRSRSSAPSAVGPILLSHQRARVPLFTSCLLHAS